MTLAKHLLSVVVGIAMACLPAGCQQSLAQPAAVVPRLMNFSGRATDAQSRTMTGVVGVTFAIYRDQHEGTPLWLETQNVAADQTGHYSVQLGSTKSEGLPLELFSSGEARWLGVRVSGGEEQPRVLLLSVPYALKAADSETLGGFPASAFILAAPADTGVTRATAPANVATDNSVPTTGTLTGTGTTNYVPLWTGASSLGNSALFQTGTGSSARIGINTSTPSSALDVKGAATFRGAINMAATGLATKAAGMPSQAQNFVASAYNSSTATPVNEAFHWRAEPVGNNTNHTSGSLNLLFAQGLGVPAETGLKIASNGHITFAAGQTFPGAGTVSSVGLSAPSSDFAVGPAVTGNGTLALNWNVAPTSAVSVNTIVKRDGGGSFSANQVGASAVVASNDVSTNYTAVVSGSSTATSNVAATYGVAGGTGGGQGAGVWGNNNNPNTGYGVVGTANNRSPAVAGFNYNSSNGVGVLGGGAWGFSTDNNVRQGLGGLGWAKAMIVYDDVDKKTILRCFNSTLVGANATTPPCGFTTSYLGTGQYDVNFGFELDNRYVVATGFVDKAGYYSTACLNQYAPANTVRVLLFDVHSAVPVDGMFQVIVY